MRNISYSSRVGGGRRSILAVVLSLVCLFVGGLAAVRLLYEWLFPAALWLGNPGAAVFIGLVIAVIGGFSGYRFLGQGAGVALTPLLLNLVHLFESGVNLTGSRFVFGASVWLAALFVVHYQGSLRRRGWLPFVFVVSFLLPVYLATMGQAVGTADTFEFQVVVPRLGIVHPTGYPLYLLLTKVFTFLPIHSVAWRVNFGTAVYGLGAACLLFQFLKGLTGQRLGPILAAVLFGLTPTFWSQAVQAEVYSLHALIVAAVLVAMGRIRGWRLAGRPSGTMATSQILGVDKGMVALAGLVGLGLTNHLTTIILLPAILVDQVLGVVRKEKGGRPFSVRQILVVLGAFLLPLALYLYLPIRWQAVNGEAMGLERFVDWVAGGRFQGALQLTGWLADPARLGVVGRLFTAEWGQTAFGLLIGLIGLIVLVRRNWRTALFLALTLAGFTYYALSYYVPDLSVFLIPAHLIIGALWGVVVAEGVRLVSSRGRVGSWVIYPALTVLMLFVFRPAAGTWEMVDASEGDGQTGWGRAVLGQGLDPAGAILADSLKFPPLYYLQQAEGVRPEMDIMVLPDEAAYRAELDGRLAAGQTVYLARFLPGLAGVYHLRSVGPLTEVDTEPLGMVVGGFESPTNDISFGSIKLVGYELEMESPFEAEETAVTLYWQTAEGVEDVWLVHVRWVGEEYSGPVTGQHPANNFYPTNGWRAGEVVADYHGLQRPILNETAALALQVALAPAFTPLDELGWQTVTTAVWEPADGLVERDEVRVQVGPLLVEGVSFSAQIRPGSDLLVQLEGVGATSELLSLELRPVEDFSLTPATHEAESVDMSQSFVWSREVGTDVEPGSYFLVASYGGEGADTSAVCSWLAAETTGCVLGEVEVSGAPLPEGSVNFEDRIALLAIDVPDRMLQPGGELAVNLMWQGLGNMEEDYTVFLQVVDEQDRIVGQVDSWPLQGTFPTSAWEPGERVEDPYLVRLSEDLPPGQYRLYVGWYLLGSSRRLAVVDGVGTAVDDKIIVPLDVR